jgi:co-chaperonin GroES (HSP10)
MPKKEEKTYLLPQTDRLLIKPEEFESEGTIIIPETAKDSKKTNFGTVIAYGKGKIMATESGVQRVPMEELLDGLSVGCRVLFGEWSGQPVEIDDEKHSICRVEDIYGILLNEEEHEEYQASQDVDTVSASMNGNSGE